MVYIFDIDFIVKIYEGWIQEFGYLIETIRSILIPKFPIDDYCNIHKLRLDLDTKQISLMNKVKIPSRANIKNQ